MKGRARPIRTGSEMRRFFALLVLVLLPSRVALGNTANLCDLQVQLAERRLANGRPDEAVLRLLTAAVEGNREVEALRKYDRFYKIREYIHSVLRNTGVSIEARVKYAQLYAKILASMAMQEGVPVSKEFVNENFEEFYNDYSLQDEFRFALYNGLKSAGYPDIPPAFKSSAELRHADMIGFLGKGRRELTHYEEHAANMVQELAPNAAQPRQRELYDKWIEKNAVPDELVDAYLDRS